MTTPNVVDLAADTWVKVASGVTAARVWLIKTSPNLYLHTYVAAGAAAPASDSGAVVHAFGDRDEDQPSEEFSFEESSDIYYKAKGSAGQVRVDVNAPAGFDAVSGGYETSEKSPAHTWGPIGPEELITAAQDLTASWADLGGEIEMGGYTELLLWLTVDINDSLDVRIRALVKHEQGGAEEFNLPIQTIAASDVKIEDHYFELNVDADQLIVLPFHLPNDVPFVQIQVSAGTAGATPGQIDAAEYTRSWAGGGDGN